MVQSGNQTVRVPVTVVGLSVLDAHDGIVDPSRDAVGVSHAITNDASLPRRSAWDGQSPDPDNVRLEILDPRGGTGSLSATLESLDPATGVVHGTLAVTLTRPRPGLPFRSRFLRLVGDDVDANAPGVGGQVLRVALRDAVRLRYDGATQSVRVGRPGDEQGPRAARRGHMRIHILRMGRHGTPVIGTDDASAFRLGRRQVQIANEIWLQCFVGWGTPAQADVDIVAPPPPTLVSIANADGLTARGHGVIRLRIEGHTIPPVTTVEGAAPVSTALALAAAIEAAGFRTRVTENAPTEFGAGRSADVLVRTREGAPVTITPDGSAPLGTDAQQSVSIGKVDLSDGIREFDNMNAAAGTLEERTLVEALADDDPSTIDIFIINRFTAGTRQGESFIEGDGGAILNALILDRTGIEQEQQAWTQSHEIGHVLEDQPFHPDNVGPDRPWLLMDADSSQGTVTGPKRLTWQECDRVRVESGVNALPTLLTPMDPRTTPPPRGTAHFDRGYPRGPSTVAQGG